MRQRISRPSATGADRSTPPARSVPMLRRPASPAGRGRRLSSKDVLDLQRTAGNAAVVGLVRPVQRVGGWSDADSTPGSALAAGEARTGWNTGEHAVGGIRRIPIDGLVSGLQKDSKSDGGKALTTEEVGGTVTGPARSDPAEQKGRGRAIALLPNAIKPELPVDVLFHLHGNTENADRGFAGWRQHKKSGKARDVERDRIAQQIEGTGSPQFVGILPMGLNQSQFGAISPDSYIRDAFDRLAELGAWKTAPKDFRVVLSAHSGGGFTVERMLRGRKGYQLPAKLGMIILFEANNSRKGLGPKEVPTFQAWAIKQLDAHLAYLTSALHTAAEKTAYLANATRLRAYFDPRRGHSYGSTYRPIREAVARWLDDNGSKLGTYLPEVRGLIQVVEQPVGHEGQMRAGLGNALADLPGTPSATSGPAPAGGSGAASASGTAGHAPTSSGKGSGSADPSMSAPTGRTSAPTADTTSLADRGSAITPAMVAAQAVALGKIAAARYVAAVAAGEPKLAAAASALAEAGLRSDVDLTDALFALVRQELGGGRIPADRADLKREWIRLRSGYARPALARVLARTGAPAAGGSAAPETSSSTKAHGPGAPTKAPDTSDKPAKPATTAGTLTPEQEYESFNAKVKDAFGGSGVKRYLAVRKLYSERKETAGNPAEWLNQLQFGVAFAGTKLYGVHPKLVAALGTVDEEISKQAAAVRAAGGPVVFEGKFQPRPVTGNPKKLSDHGLGLALHLNYKNNPYVGRNDKASELIARVAAEAGQKDFWSSVRGQGVKTSQARVEEIYRRWAAASDAVARYFHEMEAMEVQAKAGKLDASQLAELKKRQDEYKQLQKSDLTKSRDPKNGVFKHTTNVEGDPMLQIIKQLTGVAGLEWGGTYKTRPKDLHHFALKP